MTRLDKLKAFLEAEPNDSFTRYAIGLEYAKENDFAKAIETLEDLRTRDGGYVPTYYMLGGYYREIGDRAKAEFVYRDGVTRARAARDLHAASELEAALSELEDEL